MSATRFVIFPADPRDVHDIVEHRVAKFTDAETAAQAAGYLNAAEISPERFMWEDYS